jgi:tetratricopeptide (TPR) repeat protein
MERVDPQLTALLESGLQLYGQNRREEAMRRWEELLARAPEHQLAREYIEAAKAREMPSSPSLRVVRDSEVPSGSGVSGVVDVETREKVLTLVRAHRLEEALQVLYVAHRQSPQDAAVSRSITVMKQRLLAEYRKELGELDGVPYLQIPRTQISRLPLTPNEEETFPLVDGLVSYSDIVRSSPLNEFVTTKSLAGLLRKGIIAVQRIPERNVEPHGVATSGSAVTPSVVGLMESTSQTPPPIAPASTRSLTFAAALARTVQAHMAGRIHEAKAFLEEAHRMCPDDAIAKRKLENLSARIGKGVR